MIQEEILVGYSNHTVGANGLITQADLIGDPTIVCLQANTFAKNCYLFQRDASTNFNLKVWKMTGTPASPAWTLIATQTVTQNNMTAVVAPTVNDDNTLGFAVGSLWFDSVTQTLYIAQSVATGAANWVAVGGGGGLSQFGYFFQTVAAVAGTIAANNGKALWSTANSNNTAGFTMVPATGDITVLNAGIYEIDWSLSAAESGAMVPYINAAKQDLAGGTYGSGAGTQQNTGKCLLVLAANDVISLRTDNCAAALTLQLAGTTNTNQVVASIMLKKVG